MRDRKAMNKWKVSVWDFSKNFDIGFNVWASCAEEVLKKAVDELGGQGPRDVWVSKSRGCAAYGSRCYQNIVVIKC